MYSKNKTPDSAWIARAISHPRTNTHEEGYSINPKVAECFVKIQQKKGYVSQDKEYRYTTDNRGELQETIIEVA